MKLASYADGSRDGHLVVVAADLTSCHYASQSVGRLQGLLDDWNFLSPQLEDLAATVNGGKARHAMPFDPGACRAPLARPPRCVRWTGADAGAPDALVEEAAWFAGPRLAGSTPPEDGGWGPHLAVVTADLPLAADEARAAESVRLYGLAVRPWAGRPAAGEGQVGAWHFAPVVVTPGDAGLTAGGWSWSRAAGGEARRGAGPADAEDGGLRIPALAEIVRSIGPALTRAAARAPMPAGSVLLVPLPEPVASAAAARTALALVDGTGDPVFGAVRVGLQPG